MEEDVALIKGILPSFDEAEIRQALMNTDDIGLALKSILMPGSPQIRRGAVAPPMNTTISVHRECGEMVMNAVRNAIKSLRGADIVQRPPDPRNEISVSFQGNQCKPVIYVCPEPFDACFCQHIERRSIVITTESEDMELKTIASFYGLIILPFSEAAITTAIRQVLIENGIIGDGTAVRKYGELWQEMLREIPLISSTYAEVISAAIPSPFAVVHNMPESVISKGGNKLPGKVLMALKRFYESDDPNEKLEYRGNRS
jgi:hypothetical protein